MSGPEPSNRQPVLWDCPHRDAPEKAWYHPRTLWWLLTDMLFVLRWYVWHKRRSLQANRGSLEHNLATAVREIHFIKQDNHVPDRRREDLEAVERSLAAVADELTIESRHIDRFVDEESGESE